LQPPGKQYDNNSVVRIYCLGENIACCSSIYIYIYIYIERERERERERESVHNYVCYNIHFYYQKKDRVKNEKNP